MKKFLALSVFVLATAFLIRSIILQPVGKKAASKVFVAPLKVEKKDRCKADDMHVQALADNYSVERAAAILELEERDCKEHMALSDAEWWKLKSDRMREESNRLAVAMDQRISLLKKEEIILDAQMKSKK